MHAKLKQRAKEARMSLSDYVAQELAAHVATKSNREILEWAAKRRDTGLTSQDVVDAIHAGRADRE